MCGSGDIGVFPGLFQDQAGPASVRPPPGLLAAGHLGGSYPDAVAAAAYALITYRGVYGFQADRVLIVNGKFVGKVTGYETILYILASFPIILLIMRRSTRILGYGLLVLYLGARLGDAYDRVSAVSLLLSVTMVAAAIRARKWPPRFWIGLFLAFTLLMQVRGHTSFSKSQKSGMLTSSNLEEGIKRGEDTSMLATLYLSTYLYDKMGYSYGAPLVSGLLFGPFAQEVLSVERLADKLFPPRCPENPQL